MIEGEYGEAIFDRIVALQMDAAIEPDSITAGLIAATYADAIRKGLSPRQVAADLRSSLPSDYDWESRLRDFFHQAIEAREGEEAA